MAEHSLPSVQTTCDTPASGPARQPLGGDVMALLEGIAEGTDELIAAQDADHRYLFFNEAYRHEFKTLWGRDLEVGTSMVEAMAAWPEEMEKARTIWRRALDGERFRVLMEFGPAADRRNHYDLRFGPVYDRAGRQIGAVHLIRDVSAEVRLREALETSERRARRILDNIADGFLALDHQGRVTFVNAAAEVLLAPTGLTAAGLIGQDLVQALPPELGGAFAGVVERARDDAGGATGEVKAADLWLDLRAYPSGEEIYLHCTDVSERRKAEQLRDLLMGEMNHRVKNTLAIVQSIAQQTFRGAVDPAIRRLFDGRVAALAAANNMLVRGDWKPSTIERIARDVLEFATTPDAPVSLDGPETPLQPRQAIYFAMALHELATNAAKYGALSTDRGRVEVTWRRDPADPGHFELTWTERGGPTVALPQRRGFGTRMIEQALAAEFNGRVQQDFRPEGLVCHLVGRLTEADADDMSAAMAPGSGAPG